MNNNDKFLTIVKQEKEILEQIKNDIIRNQLEMNNNINKVSSYLNVIESNEEKKKTVQKIQETISTILNRIVNAESNEELVNLRKELNKEINKVRRVLKKIPNYDATESEQMIKNTRNNISKMYRNEKRQDKIKNLEELLSREDTLTAEERKILINGLKNEKSYIKRNSVTNNTLGISRIIIKDKMKENTKDNNSQKKPKIIFVKSEDMQANKDKQSIQKSGIEPNIRRGRILLTKNEVELLPIIKKSSDQEKISNYLISYNIKPTEEYNGTVASNIVTFFKNIPIYCNNKRSFKRLKYDYDHFSNIKMIKDLMKFLSTKYNYKTISSEIFNVNIEECNEKSDSIEHIQRVLHTHRSLRKQAN